MYISIELYIYINVELVVYGGFLVLIFYTVYLVMYGNGMIKLGDPQNPEVSIPSQGLLG